MTIEEMCQKMSDRVTDYRNDLEIDKETIAQYPGRKFLAFARDWGTHMIMFYELNDLPKEGEKVNLGFGYMGDRETLIREQYLGSMKHFSKNDKEYQYNIYYFDGEKVVEITLKGAETIVNWEYSQILKKFKEERNYEQV